MVEKVIDLREELDAPAHLVVQREVNDAIAGRVSRPEVIDAVRLVPIILVSAGVRTPHGLEIQVRGDFRGGLVFRERLQKLARQQAKEGKEKVYFQSLLYWGSQVV